MIDRSELAYEVARARLGQPAGLVTLLGPRLHAHARRLVDAPEEARDVVQTAWIAILRGLGGLRDDHAALAWALRIVTRAAVRQGRLDRRDRLLRADLAAVAPEAPDPADAAGSRDALQRALSALPGEMRATLALFYLDELSVAEVALALDIPPGTVKTRLMHGRARLRALLEGEDNGQV